MPERSLTIAAYAAGASLAAVTLVYVFGPTFFFDDEAANSSSSARKKGVVGLYNSANDCFINSVLQALAGLPELRLYLIREVHRRNLDGSEMYQDLQAALEEQERSKSSKKLPEWQMLGLQRGIVTTGLKNILDALNERPLYKKTINAQAFIRVVEEAFRIRMSRAQQDAQEFLQIVAERLHDENQAGRRVRKHVVRRRPAEGRTESREGTVGASTKTHAVVATLMPKVESDGSNSPTDSKIDAVPDSAPHSTSLVSSSPATATAAEADNEDEPFTFPLEGKHESQVECSHCHFKPRPHVSTFVTLTLHVPQSSGPSSLNACFDGMFKQEQIDDFTCDRCRLEHALQVTLKQLYKSSISESERAGLEADRLKIEHALREDPEKPPEDVKLPDLSSAPKRRISRHMRISVFPRILSLHLSRSVWDPGSSSSKNTAKVSFPETLSLGGLLDRKTYRLLAVTTHKGAHNSGHYETFRRQFLNAPYSTPALMGSEGIYGVRSTPAPSPLVSASSSPDLNGEKSSEVSRESSSATPDQQFLSTPPLRPQSNASTSSSSRPQQSPVLDRRKATTPHSIPFEAMPAPGLPTPPQSRQAGSEEKRPTSSLAQVVKSARRKKGPERWWRISDDKIKECKTSDVLGMQREVYLLFYELIEEEV